MAWGKLDDGYYDNPKLLAAGLTATGLHARAISYSCKHETDGKVPAAWVDGQLSELAARDRRAVLDRLDAENLMRRENGGYIVNDFLDYNPSRADLARRREDDRKRKGIRDGS